MTLEQALPLLSCQLSRVSGRKRLTADHPYDPQSQSPPLAFGENFVRQSSLCENFIRKQDLLACALGIPPVLLPESFKLALEMSMNGYKAVPEERF